MKKKKSRFMLGAVLGLGVGLLFAPRSGRETRKILSEKATEIFDQLKDLDMEEVKNNIADKITEIRDDIKDLDKEKIVEIAREKGEALKNKAEDLVELAKKTGKPIVEEATETIKKSVVNLAKEVIDKLETKKAKN